MPRRKVEMKEYTITGKIVSPVVLVVHASSEAEADRLARKKEGRVLDSGPDEVFVMKIESEVKE